MLVPLCEGLGFSVVSNNNRNDLFIFFRVSFASLNVVSICFAFSVKCPASLNVVPICFAFSVKCPAFRDRVPGNF